VADPGFEGADIRGLRAKPLWSSVVGINEQNSERCNIGAELPRLNIVAYLIANDAFKFAQFFNHTYCAARSPKQRRDPITKNT